MSQTKEKIMYMVRHDTYKGKIKFFKSTDRVKAEKDAIKRYANLYVITQKQFNKWCDIVYNEYIARINK